METVFVEQQRIALRKNSGVHKPGTFSFYLIQMPSESLSLICVLQLMQNILKNFVYDKVTDEMEDVNFSEDLKTLIKIPTIQLIDQLG